MNQIDQWFFQRTGCYPTAILHAQLSQAFMLGYLLTIKHNLVKKTYACYVCKACGKTLK